MSTTQDIVTNNSAGISDHKRVPSEKSRQIVLDMIDEEVKQFIVDRSVERRKQNGVKEQPQAGE